MRTLFSSAVIAALPMLFAAAASAQSVGAVKVDCEGNCNNVRLGDICDTLVPNSEPVAVACDDTADPGESTGEVRCGSTTASRRPTCAPYGLLYRGDRLGDYCDNGSYNDAIVTCQIPSFHAVASEEGQNVASDSKEEEEYDE